MQADLQRLRFFEGVVTTLSGQNFPLARLQLWKGRCGAGRARADGAGLHALWAGDDRSAGGRGNSRARFGAPSSELHGWLFWARRSPGHVAVRGLAPEGPPKVHCLLKPPPNSIRDSSHLGTDGSDRAHRCCLVEHTEKWLCISLCTHCPRRAKQPRPCHSFAQISGTVCSTIASNTRGAMILMFESCRRRSQDDVAKVSNRLKPGRLEIKPALKSRRGP